MTDKTKQTDIIIIGAGPVGLTAAAHMMERGLTPLILEKGPSAGHAMLKWGHVRVFTPWEYITDNSVLNLLAPTEWTHPDPNYLPTGREIVEQYLAPVSKLPAFNDKIIYGACVSAVSKRKLSKSSSLARDEAPFTIHYQTDTGEHHIMEAATVIDASGTWFNPNPIGADGLPVPGEREFSDQIFYGIPDTLGKDTALYAGKRTLVLGGGHSAINVILDILGLKEETADTKIVWGLRHNKIDKLLGGGINDKLPARGALGMAAKKAIDEGALDLLAPINVRKISKAGKRMVVKIDTDGKDQFLEVDRIVVTAGFRPDLAMLREIRLDLDDVVEAPTLLAPMIDPNLHSCGTVRPHGVVELSHTDKNFFIVGMKAYGRAPTFLMKTGYEQVRSIADELAGNHDKARVIELILPETGICNSRPQTSVTVIDKPGPGIDGECCVTSTLPPTKNLAQKSCC
ncbi:MAG: NAD(P)-binding domain-containing protein [Hellea sp.]